LTFGRSIAKLQKFIFVKEVIMRNVRISEEVWQAIAERGKFGETEDDVLRRILDLPSSSGPGGAATTAKMQSTVSTDRAAPARRRSFATQRMTSYIARNQLHIEFQDGASSSWALPNPTDKAGIRAILDKALEFARDHGASIGQINAARKTLTNEGIWLTK
jgi:hypothetical protein